MAEAKALYELARPQVDSRHFIQPRSPLSETGILTEADIIYRRAFKGYKKALGHTIKVLPQDGQSLGHSLPVTGKDNQDKEQ